MSSPRKNGAVARVNVLDLGDLSPVFKRVSITRDGKKEHLEAYAEAPSCPASVRVRLARAHQEYKQALQDNFGKTDGQPELYEYVREMLLIVIDKLTFDEADLLAGDTDKAGPLLEELGWLTPISQAEDEVPEVTGEETALTGEVSSPS